MWRELVIRFLVGGVLVSAFAVLGNLFKPKSFAGLFGAAPSVALASVTLTLARDGSSYTRVEARSMLAGAAGLLCYSVAVVLLLTKTKWRALAATLMCLPVWFVVAFGLWFALLK